MNLILFNETNAVFFVFCRFPLYHYQSHIQIPSLNQENVYTARI